MQTHSNSLVENTRNLDVLPGGVSSVNRVIDPPLVWERARGAEIIDVDGNVYIDYNTAFGATILGHCHPAVNAEIAETLQHIDLIGIGTTRLEAQLARKLVQHIPSAEMAVLVSSGSEATQLALRLARAVTGRSRIIKFQGCYHGNYDYVAMNLASAPNRLGQYDPLSAGALKEAAAHTLVLPYNDGEAVERTMREQSDDIAAIILEPIAHNIGCVQATGDFLALLRAITLRCGALLIFDEVVTGIRHGLGGYQAICNITPDLTTIGKALGNGFPIAAVVGRAEWMRRCAPRPAGDVFSAGTMNGTPAMCAAALATIKELEAPDSYPALYELGDQTRSGLKHILENSGFAAQVAGYGSVWLVYFTDARIERYESLLGNDSALDCAFRRGLLKRGILGPCTPLKRYNFTLSHTREHVSRTLAAAEEVIQELQITWRSRTSIA